MPQLGESVTEGIVARWLKAVGDPVQRYEPLLEVVTDKVHTEVPSPAAGILEAILVPEGETVPVGTVLARLRLPEDATAGPPPVQASAEFGEAGPAPVSSPAPAEAGTPAGELPRGLYSPVVRRLAAEYGVDLRQVPGTGLGGRVTREDLLAYLEQQTAPEPAPEVAESQAPAAPATPALSPVPAEVELPVEVDAPAEPAAPAPSSAPAGPVDPLAAPPVQAQVPVQPGTEDAQAAPGADEAPVSPPAAAPAPAERPAPTRSEAGVERVKPSPARRIIAQRMVQSRQEIPHAWTMVEVDVTGLVRLVEAEGERFKAREGAPLTYLPFVIEAAARALKKYPLLNASWQDGEIVLHRQIHIGVPVGLEDSVIVPVIRDADQKSVAGLAQELRRLVERARSGQLTLAEVEGATFTVNNTGAFGSILSQPIINPPQAAMLTLEAIVKRPVVVENDAIAIRHMVNLCLSLDHRVIDGLYAGRFLQQVKARLESYGPDTPL